MAGWLPKLTAVPLRESWVMFQYTPCLAYLIYIICKYHIVRIAHRYECAFIHAMMNQELGFVFQLWLEHINGHAIYLIIYYVQIQYFDS